MSYILTIKPAIPPEERHKIEDVLKEIGYTVTGGGQQTDGSQCDVGFRETDRED